MIASTPSENVADPLYRPTEGIMVGIKTLAIAFTLSLTVAAAGCATKLATEIDSSFDLRSDQAGGVLAVGMTVGDGGLDNASWHLRNLDTGNELRVQIWSFWTGRTWKNGRFILLDLPEGRYEFFDWSTVSGEPTYYFAIPFEVRSGRVTYLGRMHLEILEQRFKIVFENHIEEDLPLIEQALGPVAREHIEQQTPVVYNCSFANCEKPGRPPMIIPIVF